VIFGEMLLRSHSQFQHWPVATVSMYVTHCVWLCRQVS